jgi:hypothetical protein
MTTNLATKLRFTLAPSVCPHCGEDMHAKILRVTGDTVRDVFTATLEERAGKSLYLVERYELIKVVVLKLGLPRKANPSRKA